MNRRRSTIFAAVSAAMALALIPGTASAQESSFPRGPAPTEQSISATTGPFATSLVTVPDSASPNFGSASITFPTSRTEGTFGVVAIAPGYTASESSVAWLRPRIASQGFVVISFNTNSRTDQPAARGRQLLAALDFVINSSSVRDRVDPSRQAVIGHSMGGGGALAAAASRDQIEAAVPLTGWNTDRSWPEVEAATLVIGAENDSVAPASSYSIPFFTGLTNAEERAYLELNGASHFTPNSPNTPIARNTIAWLKRFVDNDTRYDQFICPPPSGSAFSDVRNSCPIG